ncbi:hypothetical protein KR093_007469 [Drosophila rubida]|uniref:Uncharacterized protein n=1 Tax=Drosophila rubida TaxID=30044 RepID=A0AAD4PQ65_9MUSC|nr:hypothetical protein KR093_007469 [Drosophila rubida]
MQLFQFAISLQLLLIVSHASYVPPNQLRPNEIRPLMPYILDVKEIGNKVSIDIVELMKESKEYDDKKLKEHQSKVLQHFKNINLLVDEIEQRYANISKKINSTTVDHHLDEGLFEYEIESLVYEMDRISNGFPKIENAQSYDISTLKSFTDALPEDSALGKPLNKAFYTGMVEPLRNYIQKEKASKYNINDQKMCKLQMFPRQYIYLMYLDVALSELRALILVEYSLVIRRVSGEAFPNFQRNMFRLNYRRTLENNLNTIHNAFDFNKPYISGCQPPEQIHKVTYDVITNLLQGYVDNVANLNTDGSCSQSCPEYQNARYASCYDQDEFCSQQPKCSGRIMKCGFVDSDMTVCQSPGNSTRRYEYIEYANGEHFGKRKSCQRSTNKVESWRRWLIQKCDYCFCLCDQEEDSDRYFNLRETKSDIAANKVVTGIRFVKKNRVFHLQIQQGKLLPRTLIDESTLEWKPVDDYKITDPHVSAGIDYHKLSYENRSINLDAVDRYPEVTRLVTGVGFEVIEGHLNLRVHYNNFNFETGELVDTDKGVWFNQEKYGREKIDLENLDVPTRSEDNWKVLSKFGQYVEFTNTGMRQDAAQTTIPYIDTQELTSLYPVPLSGIGLSYQGTSGYGGYVTPVIVQINFGYYIPRAYRDSITFEED